MSDIAAANVTYTAIEKQPDVRGRRVRSTVAFGNATLTYPTNGIPLTRAKLGCPNVIREFMIEDAGQDSASTKGLLFKFDKAHETIRIYRSATVAVTGNVSSNSAGTPAGNVAAPTLSLASNSGNVAADKVVGLAALANNTSLVANTNLTGVTGIQAPAFTGDALATHGHTLTGDSVSAAALSEFSGAVPATNLVVNVVGY